MPGQGAALVSERLGRPTAALKLWQQAVGAAPQEGSYHLGAARVHEALGQQRPAWRSAYQAASLDPTHVPTQLTLARLALGRGALGTAAAALRNVLKALPCTAMCVYMQGSRIVACMMHTQALLTHLLYAGLGIADAA